MYNVAIFLSINFIKLVLAHGQTRLWQVFSKLVMLHVEHVGGCGVRKGWRRNIFLKVHYKTKFIEILCKNTHLEKPKITSIVSRVTCPSCKAQLGRYGVPSRKTSKLGKKD